MSMNKNVYDMVISNTSTSLYDAMIHVCSSYQFGAVDCRLHSSLDKTKDLMARVGIMYECHGRQ